MGFLLSVFGVLGTLDMGLASTVTRQVARNRGDREKSDRTGHLVSTLYCMYCAIGLTFGAIVYLKSDWIASYWLNADALDTVTITSAIRVFAVTIVVRWPLSLVRGVFRGLEEQVRLNLLIIAADTFQRLGSILLVVFGSAGVVGILYWGLISAVLESCFTTGIAISRLRHAQLPVRIPRLASIRGEERFIAGMSFSHFFAVLMKQADRLIISALLPLSSMGYYQVASNAVGSLSDCFKPISKAVYPRLCLYIKQDRLADLESLFFRSAHTVMLVAAPAFVTVALMSHDLLLAWTRSTEVADNAGSVLSVLAVASLVGAGTQMPQSLEMAHGRTRLFVLITAVGGPVMLGLTYVLIDVIGIDGAAIGLLVHNHLVFGVFAWSVVWRGMDGTRFWRFARQTFLPAMLAVAILAAVRHCLPDTFGIWRLGVGMLAGELVYGALSLWIFADVRQTVLGLLRDAVRAGRRGGSPPSAGSLPPGRSA